MKPTRLVPALPEEGSRQGDGPRWGLAASAVGHGLLILALFGLAIRQLPPDGSPAPSYDLMFEGPSSGAPAADAPQTEKLPPAQTADIPPPPDTLPGPPAPTPLSTPDPNSATVPPPAAAASPAPDAMPPPAPTSARQTAQPAPVSAPPPLVTLALPSEPATLPPPTPQEAPPTMEAPAVRLEVPPDETAPATPQPIMPLPPPPLPQVNPQPRPTRQTARPAPRLGSAVGSLSNPMDLSLAPAASRPAARGSVASRSLDLSAPRAHDGPATSDPYAEIRAANASVDWNRALHAYWERHRFYPEQAALNGEQGAVTIQLTVNRSGRVESVEVLSRSGSQWLDMAAVSTWRDARLPPFTSEMRDDRITFSIPIQYYLVRN